jgi:hypothetical protein
MKTLVLLFLLMQTAPTVPAEWGALWSAGIGAVTAALLQGLKAVATPIGKLPDIVKATLAFVIAFITTKLAVVFGAPIPADLAGFAGVVVNFTAAMGLHALAKKLGVVHDEAPA